MKKFITLMILSALCLGAKAQQINGDFDDTWEDCIPWDSKGNTDVYGTQPSGWKISNVCGMSGMGATIVGKSVSGFTGSNGDLAVELTNTPNLYRKSEIVPAYLTLGTSWATAKASFSSVSNADGGTFGGKEFSYRPDALSFFYKRTLSNGSTENATIVAYLWRGTFTQNNVPGNTTMGTPTKVTMNDRDRQVLGVDMTGCQGGDQSQTVDASCIASINHSIVGEVTEWSQMVLDFDYKSEEIIPEKINVIFAADDYFGDRSKIGKNNTLTIDNVKLIYYHSLAKCTYDGQQVTFDGNNSASVSALYDRSKLDYVKKGVGATVKEEYNNATGKLTITVKGNDNSADNPSVTTYTIQFKKPSDVVSEKSYTETLYVTINCETTEPQDANVLVQTRYDGNFNFVLKNFVLGGSMPVGNINVPSLTKNADGSFSFQGITSIEAGDLEGVAEDEWLGPGLGEVPLDLKGQFVGEDHLRVSIDIDMTSTLEQFIYVHLGYDAASLAVNSAAQYGTFCAPFDVTIPAGVQAFTIGGIAENGKLTLFEQQNTIPAHTPVIVYSESASGINEVQFGVATSGTATSKYLTGVYTDTEAPVGSYVLQNQRGKVGFYKVQEGIQPMVRANRAYLTVPASANVKAFYMDDATAIQTVEELLSGKAEIYDLAGRRQQKLQKGINIVGGKKVLVK